jgi:putative transcriptional regulator
MNPLAMSEPLELSTGKLLIANAHLEDQNFKRSVILICEHSDDGTFGLALNRPLELSVNEVIEDLDDWNAPLYLGGPVQPNTIHVLHRLGDKIEGSTEIVDGVFWGGDYDEIRRLIELKAATADDFRFFLGYSGWGAGQLNDELQGGSWYLSQATEKAVFNDPHDKLWSRALRAKGGEFAIIANFPEDPRLN